MRIIVELGMPDIMGRVKYLLQGEPGFDGTVEGLGEPGPMGPEGIRGPMGPAGPAFKDAGLMDRLEKSWEKIASAYDEAWENLSRHDRQIENLFTTTDRISVLYLPNIVEGAIAVRRRLDRIEKILSEAGHTLESDETEPAVEGDDQ